MDCYMGAILPWALSWAPYNFNLCWGTQLSINQYQAVYSLIGITYGGNAQSNFNLPDLRGRMPIGYGQFQGGTPVYNIGQTGGIASNSLSIGQNNLPAHVHPATFTPVVNQQTITIPAVSGAGSLSTSVTAKVSTGAGNQPMPTGNVYLAGLAADDSNGGSCSLYGPYASTQSGTTANLQGISASVTPSTDYRPASPAATATITALSGGVVSVGPGGGVATPTPLVQNNLPPYQVVNFIFCMQGIYPQRE